MRQSKFYTHIRPKCVCAFICRAGVTALVLPYYPVARRTASKVPHFFSPGFYLAISSAAAVANFVNGCFTCLSIKHDRAPKERTVACCVPIFAFVQPVIGTAEILGLDHPARGTYRADCQVNRTADRLVDVSDAKKRWPSGNGCSVPQQNLHVTVRLLLDQEGPDKCTGGSSQCMFVRLASRTYLEDARGFGFVERVHAVRGVSNMVHEFLDGHAGC